MFRNQNYISLFLLPLSHWSLKSMPPTGNLCARKHTKQKSSAVGWNKTILLLFRLSLTPQHIAFVCSIILYFMHNSIGAKPSRSLEQFIINLLWFLALETNRNSHNLFIPYVYILSDLLHSRRRVLNQFFEINDYLPHMVGTYIQVLARLRLLLIPTNLADFPFSATSWCSGGFANEKFIKKLNISIILNKSLIHR